MTMNERGAPAEARTPPTRYPSHRRTGLRPTRNVVVLTHGDERAAKETIRRKMT